MAEFELLLNKILGTGTFGKVYEGRRRSNGGKVAFKVTMKDSLQKGRSGEILLKKEIDTMKGLDHPNVVKLLDVQETEKEIHLIMEFCGGGDLADRLERESTRRLPESVVRRYLRHLASALHYIWSKDIVHRDLKPQNLMLTSKDDATAELKMCDFGLVTHLTGGAMAQTLCGSPLYCAPEVLFGEHYDAKCDLWSVGIILFEMVNGYVPFNGKDLVDFKKNLRTTNWRIPDEIALSDNCFNFLTRLLVKRRVDRISYEDFFAHEFLQVEQEASANVAPFRLDASILPANMRVLAPIDECESKYESEQDVVEAADSMLRETYANMSISDESKTQQTPEEFNVTVTKPDGPMGLTFVRRDTALYIDEINIEKATMEIQRKFSPGDKILEMNGLLHTKSSTLRDAIQKMEAGTPMVFKLECSPNTIGFSSKNIKAQAITTLQAMMPVHKALKERLEQKEEEANAASELTNQVMKKYDGTKKKAAKFADILAEATDPADGFCEKCSDIKTSSDKDVTVLTQRPNDGDSSSITQMIQKLLGALWVLQSGLESIDGPSSPEIEGKIDQLRQMGFTHAEAKQALQAAENNLEQAINHLLSTQHESESADSNDMMGQMIQDALHAINRCIHDLHSHSTPQRHARPPNGAEITSLSTVSLSNLKIGDYALFIPGKDGEYYALTTDRDASYQLSEESKGEIGKTKLFNQKYLLGLVVHKSLQGQDISNSVILPQSESTIRKFEVTVTAAQDQDFGFDDSEVKVDEVKLDEVKVDDDEDEEIFDV